MELRHLRYFVAVAEELNFTRAALRLHVAQPALSTQIKDLEDELETRLFERGRAGVQLTRSGKAFLLSARKILAEASSAVNAARTAGGLITGTLTLGFPSGLHLNFLAPVVETFRRAHPKAELDFIHALPAQQIKALRDNRMDIAFINLPAQLDGLDQQVIWRVPFNVVLPRRHRLAQRRSFELQDLRGEEFVFCTRESRPEFYDDFLRHCANAGFQPHIVKEVGGYPTNMLALVSVGIGVSVLPQFEGIEKLSGLAWRTLTKPKLWIDWALVWRKTDPSPIIEQFVACATRHFGTPADDPKADL